VGDLVIIVSYAWMDAAEAKSHVPQVVHVDAANRITN
jgi:aspartate 1-decarboxylase